MNTPINNIITEPLSPETVEAIEMQAELETIRRTTASLAREMFNLTCADLILKYKGHLDLVLSPEWKEASRDLYAMAGREEGDCITSDFFVTNARLINSLSTQWTSERTF